jgi:hypothetical protein
MDTTEKDIRNLFANTGELDRDEVACLLLQLVERIQNLEGLQPKREWVGLTMEEVQEVLNDPRYQMKPLIAHAVETKLKEKNT